MDLTLGNSHENDERWGPHMAVEGGLIVEPGPDELNGVYNHRFGGNSWRVVDAAHPEGTQLEICQFNPTMVVACRAEACHGR